MAVFLLNRGVPCAHLLGYTSEEAQAEKPLTLAPGRTQEGDRFLPLPNNSPNKLVWLYRIECLKKY